jgi:hypothetical protein
MVAGLIEPVILKEDLIGRAEEQKVAAPEVETGRPFQGIGTPRASQSLFVLLFSLIEESGGSGIPPDPESLNPEVHVFGKQKIAKRILLQGAHENGEVIPDIDLPVLQAGLARGLLSRSGKGGDGKGEKEENADRILHLPQLRFPGAKGEGQFCLPFISKKRFFLP